MEQPHPAPRASDRDREDVVERLREAAADGRLEMAEFHERMTLAYAARTKPELAPLLADLQETSGAYAAPLPAPPADRIAGMLSSTQRRGTWAVPQHIDVNLFMASACLDLTGTAIPDHIEIDLGLVLSSVEVIVPAGVHVRTDTVRNLLSSVSDRSRGTYPPAASVHLRGHATLSSVTVKTPHALTQWWRDVTGGT